MKAYLTKTKTGTLIPYDEQSQATLSRWKAGEVRQVSWRKARNPDHHRKLFAILSLTVANEVTGRWRTVEALLQAIKLELGHYDIVQRIDGTPLLIPKSISFDTMDQEEFETFYNGAIQICADLLDVDVPALESVSQQQNQQLRPDIS